MATIRQLTKHKNFHRKEIVVSGVAPPPRAAAVYRQSLDTLITQMNSTVKSNILPVLKQREDEYLTDSLAQDMKAIIREIRDNFLNIQGFATKTARQHGRIVEAAHFNTFVDKFSDAVGVDITSTLEDENMNSALNAHVRENVALIKTVPKEYFARIEEAVLQGTATGQTVGRIQREMFTTGKDAKVIGVLGITQRRAKLIARDQTNKLNGTLTGRRQVELGINEYRWRTVGDKRVRDSHRELNHEIFNWKGGTQPPEGHPGQPIQCRCQALAIIRI